MAEQLTYKTLPPQSLQADATASRKRTSAVVSAIISCLVVALLGASLPVMLAACISAACLRVAVLAAAVAGIVFGVLVSLLKGRGVCLWIALGIFLLGFCLIIVLPSARLGLFGLVNALISLFDDAFKSYATLIVDAPTIATSRLFAALFGVCTTALAAVAVSARSSRISLLVIAVAVACTLVLGCGYQLPGLCLASCGWLLMMRLLQLEKATDGLGIPLADAFTVAIVALALCIIPATLYSPTVIVAETNAALEGGLDSLRYGSDTLPQGDLTQAYAMNEGDDSCLEITTSRAWSSALLLGGFVGATYEDGTWQALSHTAYEGDWTGMFDWLQSRGLSVRTERATYQDFSAEHGGENYPSATVSIKATGANRKYVYVPYSLRALDGATIMGGVDIGSVATGVTGPTSYSFEAYELPADDGTQQPAWLEQPEAASDESLQAASVYADFVDETYLDVPSELEDDIDRLFFDETTWDAQAGSSVYAIVSRVRTMLSTQASYTSTPSEYTASGNFITWFMEQERQGNSAYFATAAVLAFRQAGIPARYVEGYRASEDVLEPQATATLTAEDAHAWAEIYVDGFGWVPVEVTPGYYEQVYLADEVIEVSESSSNGSGADDPQAGSVAGDLDDDEQRAGSSPASFAEAFLILVLVIVVIIALACGIGIGVRRWRIAKREKAIASEDQSVSVPALYAYLAACLANSDIGFDEGKPFDCIENFAAAYPDIDPAELERVVRLHQDFAFGGRELRPHELRTLRRFVKRVHAALPPAQNSRASVRRIFIDVL